MSLPRYAHRDAVEVPIVEALRAVGAVVVRINARDVPDLLVGHRGVWRLLEVKGALGRRGGSSADGQRLSRGQAEFHAVARASRLPIAVVRTPMEALAAIEIDTRGTA